MKNKLLILLFLVTLLIIPKVNAYECDEGGYVVTYDANGGVNASSPTCVYSTLSTIKPIKTGYKFAGWSTIKNGEVVYKAGQEVELTGDITLYAVWAKQLTLTYNANGGSVSSDTKKVYNSLKYGTLLTPTRKGYKFLGWFTKETDGDLIDESTIVTKTKNHTVYAHWKKKTYTITYELNGGIQNDSNKLTYKVTTGTFKLYNPTKKGYVFKGWYKESTFKNKVTYIYKGTTGNKTFYAKWAKIKYSIKYYGNGYTSGSTQTQSGLKYNNTYTLNANGFKKTDYVFKEWNTASDGSGKSYENKASIKNLTSKDGKVIKLYAIWKRKEYKITYVLDGGVNPTDQYTKYTKASSITLKEPTRDGYKFLGWYTDSTFKTKVTKIEKGTTGNKTFYAKWKFQAYVITYNLNGGTNPNDTITTYQTTDEVLLPTPTRKGYTFVGWYTNSNFDSEVITTIPLGSSGNKSYYAKWNIIEYNITYKLNSGTNPSGVKTKYTVEDDYILPIPTRTNYVFLGWYNESSFNNEIVKINKGTTGDKVLYANWTQRVVYTITYNLNGGTNPSNAPTSYDRSEEVILPTPTRNGYTFAGWYKESNFATRVTKLTKNDSGNKTFYAKWTGQTYSITYVLNGGSNPSNAPANYTAGNEVDLPYPSRRGYIFEGWFTNSNFNSSTQVETINVNTTGNQTFYAKWKINEFTITYYLNGGTNPSNAPTSYTINDSVTLPTPTRKGYTFFGWCLDLQQCTAQNKITSIPSGTVGNLELYAKWTINTYTITYNLNGGTNPSGAPTSYTVENAITLPTPTKNRYDFGGWYTTSNYSGSAVTTIPVGTAENKVYYAKWNNPQTYTITYNLNSGTNPSNAPVSFTRFDSVTLPTPTRSGYIFGGWYTTSNFSGSAVTTIPVGTTENKTYYAKWTLPTTYTITYNLNGGSNPSGAPTTFTSTQSVTLPIPTKTGSSFAGWYTTSNYSGSAVTTIPVGTTENKTFYAKWVTSVIARSYDYILFENGYDNQFTSRNDIINTLYNILNDGLTSFTAYCNYSTIEACINDYLGIIKDLDLMKSISDYVNPFNDYEFIYCSRNENTGKIITYIDYIYTDSEKNEINIKLDQIISSYNINGMTERNKILTFHDYLVNNNVYDEEAADSGDLELYKDSYTAYGALINGTCVCQGYTDAMALFLDRYSIPNLRVSSDYHTWNLIYNNNSWLHLDATWDDPLSSNGQQYLLHDFFLITTTRLHQLDPSVEHMFNTSYYQEANAN